MSRENVEVVKAAYEADYRGDERAMLELLAEDVIVKNPRGLLDVPAVRHGRLGGETDRPPLLFVSFPLFTPLRNHAHAVLSAI
jgi:ketosteroid isomerase-like protein